MKTQRIITTVGLAASVLAVALLTVACDEFRSVGKKLVVIGVDGMDPDLLQQFMSEGKMPNFQALADEGTFMPLGTSNPPQSPVAWSCFITGMDPGGHGVFDFLHRDPTTYAPASSTQTTPPISMWPLPGKYQMPSPFAEEPEPIRQGKAFWELLEAEGIASAIYRIPAAYPIQATDQLTMSDMGTPDLQGGIDGVYFYYSTEIPPKLLGDHVKMHQVTVDDHAVHASLIGPPSLFIEGEPLSRTPFSVYLDPTEASALIEVDGGASLLLDEGQWSDWHEVSFDLGLLQTLSGICRFYLKEVRPTFKLYVSPINIDPLSPAFPISTPDDATVAMAEEIGRYYTQGLAEDTIALKEGVLDDGEFLQQCNLVTDERLKMLDYALDRFDDGVLFFYFSTIDLRCHMMWRHIEPGHPAREEAIAEQYKGAIEDAYRRVDASLGHLRSRLEPGTGLMVMSDHGFSPLTRKVNLNNWLLQEGYLNLEDPDPEKPDESKRAIDWSRTRAYPAGFNGIYLNLAGREAEGIVNESERDGLVEEIRSRLLQLTDPAHGDRPVVRRVDRREEIYHGSEVSGAPDLIVGYDRGYGAADDSALSGSPVDPATEVVFDNISRWSGNHLMAPEVVPGILLSTEKVQLQEPWIADVTATVLDYFDVEIPAEIVGRPLF